MRRCCFPRTLFLPHAFCVFDAHCTRLARAVHAPSTAAAGIGHCVRSLLYPPRCWELFVSRRARALPLATVPVRGCPLNRDAPSGAVAVAAGVWRQQHSRPWGHGIDLARQCDAQPQCVLRTSDLKPHHRLRPAQHVVRAPNPPCMCPRRRIGKTLVCARVGAQATTSLTEVGAPRGAGTLSWASRTCRPWMGSSRRLTARSSSS